MQKEIKNDFQDSEKRDFHVYGTRLELMIFKIRIVLAHKKMRAEQFFQRLKNRLWVG